MNEHEVVTFKPVGPGIGCDWRQGCDRDAVTVFEVPADLLACYLCDEHARKVGR